MPKRTDKAWIHPVELTLPDLPRALEGLRIAHVSDLHISRPRGRFRRLADLLASLRADLVVFTGDYINHPGDEPAGLYVMQSLCQRLQPRLGSFGVFGNHDTPQLRDTFADLPVHWLSDSVHHMPELPLDVMGTRNSRTQLPDSLVLLEALTQGNGYGSGNANGSGNGDGNRHGNGNGNGNGNGTGSRRVRLLLTHYPTFLPVAADMGVDVMLSGHTHGGQLRLGVGVSPYNSCDLPMKLTSGVLRHRDTLCAVSRGLGETFVPLRLFCPPHLPVYILRRGPLPGRSTDHVENVRPW